MTRGQIIQLYLAMLLAAFTLDVCWVGIIASGFYARQLGELKAPSVSWTPTTLFYFIYVAALITFVVQPALRRKSLKFAIRRGAFFGVTAYAAFDLTGLAVLKDFPARLALVDMTWGAVFSAAVCIAGYSIAQRWASSVRYR